MEQDAISVDRCELANLLRAFRLRREDALKVVETRLANAVRQRGSDARGKPGGSPLDSGRLGRLERGGKGRVEFSKTDWHLLAEAYGLPRLMLDPLRVPSTDVKCFTPRCDSLVALGVEGGDEYGESVRYLAPPEKLEGTTEAAFVLLQIEPGGRSQIHAHPGDELLLVLEGTIEARLDTSGLAVRLSAGDYLHFYAEQRHGVTNPLSRRAQVLVIRFYQIERSGTRDEHIRQIRQTRHDRNVTRRVFREMVAMLTPTDLREVELSTGEVRDRSGLGRLLQLLTTERFRGAGQQLSVRQLSDRMRRQKRPRTASKIDRMHHGQAAVSADELELIADVYGTEPLLLYEFLYPAFRPTIAVQKRGDWRAVPPSLLGSSACSYQVPCRRLADSDLGVAHLILPPGTTTPVNRHPGHELIVPLRGRARVCLANESWDIAEGEHLFAHYSSEIAHQVINEEREPVEMLVARFYE